MSWPFLEQNTHLRVLIGFSGAGRRLVDLAMSVRVSFVLSLKSCQKGGSSSPPPNEPDAGALPHGSSLAAPPPPLWAAGWREPPAPPPPKPPPPPPLRLGFF